MASKGLDKNTLISLMMDPKSIDLHKLALSRMKNVHIDSTAQHDFLADRARDKNYKDLDSVYRNLNELERNGTLDIWARKFGKDAYKKNKLQKVQESIEILENILIESDKVTFILDTKAILQEMDGAAAAGFSSAGSGPAAYFGGPSGPNIINKKPKTTLSGATDKTHQDIGAKGRS